MKKIGLFILLIVILAACSTTNKTMDIVRTQRVIQAIHTVQGSAIAAKVATQGSSEVGHWQFPILMLLVLLMVVPLVLVIYIFFRCFTLLKHIVWQTNSGQWVGESDTQWKNSAEPDLYQQIQFDQQWLFSQLLSQSQEEVDQPELPIDWWS